MDRIQELETALIDVLCEYRDYLNGGKSIPVQLVIDRESKHYQLLMIGWQKQKRHFGVLAHFSIQAGNLNIEYNGTEEDFVKSLEEHGVQNSELVIGFHPDSLRAMPGYAVQ